MFLVMVSIRYTRRPLPPVSPGLSLASIQGFDVTIGTVKSHKMASKYTVCDAIYLCFPPLYGGLMYLGVIKLHLEVYDISC